MGRPKKLIPSYRKHRNTGQAIVTLSGRDHYLGPFGTKASHREYDRLVAEWIASGRSASFGSPAGDLTVTELAAEYLAHARQHYGSLRGSEYFRMLRIVRTLRTMYGRSPAAEFGPLEFKAVRQQFINEDCSRTFTNSSMQRVVRIFRWAASEGRVSPNIPETLQLIPGLRRGKTEARETEPVMPVEAETVDATLPFLPPVVADMVRFERLTGCRPVEACLLRPCDLDRSGDRTGGIWLYRPSSHKTQHHGRDRVILIGPKAQEILLRYLARDAEACCFRPCDSEAKRLAARHANRKTPMSCGNRPGSNRRRKPRKAPGDRYTTNSYRRAIHRACDKAFPHATLAGVPQKRLTDDQRTELANWQSEHRWAPNQLRHAAATEVRREFGLEAAQIVLGHSQADVTQVYAERDMAKGLAVARAIG